jgi:hypothetical protein
LFNRFSIVKHSVDQRLIRGHLVTDRVDRVPGSGQEVFRFGDSRAASKKTSPTVSA